VHSTWTQHCLNGHRGCPQVRPYRRLARRRRARSFVVMNTTASLDSDSLRVNPGERVLIPLQIHNNGEIVEGYQLEVVGVPSDWASIDPDNVSLYPGTSTSATVDFHPPRLFSVPSGDVHFGVRVVPLENPDDAVVPEAVVRVEPFHETTAELVPRTSRATRSAHHKIAVDNRGNAPVEVALSAIDSSDQLKMALRPDVLTVGPGHAAFGDLEIRPVTPFWRKPPITHQFQVVALPRDASPLVLDGTYLQEPVLPAWAGKAALAGLGALLGLVAVWAWLLKPTIEGAAKEAVAEPVRQIRQEASQASDAAKNAGAAAANAGTAAKDAQDSAATAREMVGKPPLAEPFSQRLAVNVPTTGTREKTATLTVPAGKVWELTDLVLANPQGDFGLVSLQVGGNMLFQLGLENFRDMDYHFVSPIRASGGQSITMTVQCNEVGKPPGVVKPPTSCNVAAYFGGKQTTAPPRR
jgi:hypothetical protein